MKEKILVIQTAFPGDAILTLPMIQELYRINKNPAIDVVAIHATQEIFSSSPYVNKIFVLDKRNEHKSLFSIIRFSRQIKKENYTRVYSPHRSFRTALIVLLSGIKDSTGFDIASMNFVYKTKIKYRKDFHEVQRNLELLAGYTRNKSWKILPIIKVNTESVQKIDKLLKGFEGKKLAAIAPGSVWETKIYPENYFIEIIKFLRSKNFEILLIGGKTDTELCSEIEKQFDKGIFSAAGRLTIVESIQLLKHCELLVCNDSAPTHMAMCVDIPVITVYCSTVPAFGFYPYNSKSRVVSFNELSCKPCGIHGYNKCPINTFDCGKKLIPAMVINKIEEVIGER